MLVGYARVSIIEQNFDLQLDALKQAGCEKFFHDEMSGAKAERPGLSEALAFVRPGDTLVVWRLDRLGRSLKDLIQRLEELQTQSVEFRSLHESIDTASPSGKLQFRIFSALAEFERELIRERTPVGLQAARARDRMGGRRRSLSPEKVKLAARLMQDRTVSVSEICRTLNTSRATLYRYVGPKGEIRQNAT